VSSVRTQAPVEVRTPVLSDWHPKYPLLPRTQSGGGQSVVRSRYITPGALLFKVPVSPRTGPPMSQ